jgi:ethanolamine permease
MAELKKSLSPLLLWSLGVGYVISGMYFGWNLGLEKGGTYGMGIATILVIILYVCFSFSYCELACAIPKAGGGFEYANKAFGSKIGFITGLAQIIEFVFAPPAIALAIGAYVHLSFPQIPVIATSIAVYAIFTSLNIFGIKAAAIFELCITVLAVGELLLFAGITLPHFSVENFGKHSAITFDGVFAAIPFAIWFFLGIEGVANVAEETADPQKDILKGFGSALFTLVVLCVLTFVASIGVGGWQKIVFTDSNVISDSPLPLALGQIVANDSWLFHLLIGIGIFGLVASFHGLILAGGRATMEFGREGFAPKILGNVHSKFATPANALLINMALGVIALFTGKTAEIITIAVFGALTLYIISMAALIQLRKTAPNLSRPFIVPFYPILPYLAIIIGLICMIAMVYFNIFLAILYFSVLAIGYLLNFLIFKAKA